MLSSFRIQVCWGTDLPSLTTGLRGLAYWEIEVTGPNRDLHSGHFGGAVAKPHQYLMQHIGKSH